MSGTGERISSFEGDAGSTLLEMLVVMGLLVLTAGLVLPNLRRPYETLAAEAGRASVISDLRGARARAIRTGSSVAFEVSEDGREYSAGGRDVLLPESVRLIAEPRSILFEPDGASEGGRLTLLQRHGRALGVSVTPLIGVAQADQIR